VETGSDPGYESDEDPLLQPDQQHLPYKKNKGRKEVPLRLLHRRKPLLTSLTGRLCNPLRLPSMLFMLAKNLVCLPLSYYHTLHTAPPVLRNLFYADLASWIGIMAHGMFYTDFVATAVYGGRADASPGSAYDLLFDEGVRMGSWGLLLHSLTAGLYAVFIQEHMTRYLGMRMSYQLGLIVFSASMGATVVFSHSLQLINVAAAASGLGYAVVTTIPNTLVTMYHEEADLYYGPSNRGGVGEAIAILDSGYYLSQICLSLVMGRLVELTGLPHYYMIVACIAGLVAVILSDKVVFASKDISTNVLK